MAEAWEQENDFSQRDKESKRTYYAQQTSSSASAINTNTDELESLIRTLNGYTDELEGLVRTLNGKLDNIKTAVDDAKTAIVNAINSQS